MNWGFESRCREASEGVIDGFEGISENENRDLEVVGMRPSRNGTIFHSRSNGTKVDNIALIGVTGE